MFNLTNYSPATTFKIYTMDYIDSETDEDALPEDDYVAIEFTGLMSFGYKNQVNIAYEPLENAEFSSDAIQNTPYKISLVAAYTPTLSTTNKNNQDLRDLMAEVVENLEDYLQNETLLLLINSYPILKYHENVKITEFSYDFNATNTGLIVDIKLQEVRTTPAVYGALSAATVSNPEDAPIIHNGTVSPSANTYTVPALVN